MPANSATISTNGHVLKSIEEQIRDLQPGLVKQIDIVTISAELNRLQKVLKRLPDEPELTRSLMDLIKSVGAIEAGIRSGKKSLADFASVLVDLYAFQQSLEIQVQTWLDKLQATEAVTDTLERILIGIITQIRQLLNYRPDVGTILDDLTAIKNLRGGPADATAFHDFQVLQLAFRSVWLHAFNEDLKTKVAQLYEETVAVYDEAGLPFPDFGAINDINDLENFLDKIRKITGSNKPTNSNPSVSFDILGAPSLENLILPTIPSGLITPPEPLVVKNFPEAARLWALLSIDQRRSIESIADSFEYHLNNGKDDSYIKFLISEVSKIVKHPQGNMSRLTKLILEIGSYISEPYAFDVFAPNHYNYGLMITYRQKWAPGEYQAGDLVATIPLAPGETRKFSKRRVVKISRAEKEIEKSMSSRSLQSSEISRTEAEIMNKVTTATNFKMTAQGSFNIGIGNIESTSEFTVNQGQESAQNKKALHEATIKAAEEYRQERTIEIDTTSTIETEETMSGEISNPNNEITVTYLFYELQRRYKISEFLYRVRPVILVAQDVPAPHEIDEAWLIQYQWILSRVLLDDSLRPARDYLTSGFAGDEVSMEVIKAHWERQSGIVELLETKVKEQLTERDQFREDLIATTLKKAIAEQAKLPLPAKIATLGFAPDPGEIAADMLEVNRRAVESRLSYVEEALADAQDKLRQATSAFEQATKEYAAALQNQFAQHVAIDQLRVHVKQNILYYMQAIWDHEPPDQRFFRLYTNKVVCPQPDPTCPPHEVNQEIADPEVAVFDPFIDTFFHPCSPVAGPARELVEVADLDNPLGYKGNYIIFPLKDNCHLTTYMLSEFINNNLDLRDPDGSDDFNAETFDHDWNEAIKNEDQRKLETLREKLIKYITAVRRSSDEIIVPTGQLFIEALPGAHPLLEDFKLLHRFEDVRKVKAEVRHAELENLRLASRLVAGQDKTELLDDPDIEKKIIVEGNRSVNVTTP